MSSLRLTESTVTLLIAYIKANIATALSEVRSDRNDTQVTTEVPNPQSYFIYESSKAYRCPAIFVIADRADFRQSDKHQNHINSLESLWVAAVVEDRDKAHLTIKAWRYQAALVKLLEQASLTSSDSKVKLFSRVISTEYSPVVGIKDASDPQQVFRTEMALRLNVEHIENF